MSIKTWSKVCGIIILGITTEYALAGSEPPTRITPQLAGTNASSSVVEFDLEAYETVVEYQPGVPTTVWSFNGQVPGPVIKAKIGQTLVVNFVNSLPVPTAIHWHGVDTPAVMDGSNISQELIPPGGSFRYQFKVLKAATHWYHPHSNTNQQVEMGLYGPLIFSDPREDARIKIHGKQEQVLMFDDVLLDDSGQVKPFASNPNADMDPLERAEELFNARLGNVMLVNGKTNPVLRTKNGKPMRLRMINPANGRFMRLSIPGHTMYQIGGDGGLLDQIREIAPIEMVIDPATGAYISDPDPAKGLLLTPSERADVVIVPRGSDGEELDVEWHDIAYGRHVTFRTPTGAVGFRDAEDDGKRPPVSVMKIRLKGREKKQKWRPRLPLRAAPIEPIEVTDSTERMPILFGHAPPMASGNVVFFSTVKRRDDIMVALDSLQELAADASITGPIAGAVMPPMFQPLPFAAVTAEDALNATVGDVKVWYIVNFTGGDHTFHPHGFAFQPLDVLRVNLDGESAAERVTVSPLPLEIKDSIRVPGRPGSGGRSWTILRAAVRFDDTDNPPGLRRASEDMVAFGKIPSTPNPLDPSQGTSGGWVSHCHFLEHSAQGMMTFFNLLPAP